MAATIRLARYGKKGSPHYRLVVTDKRNQRDGRFLEILGHYDPGKELKDAVLKKERIHYWLSQGAQTSDRVRHILKNAAS